MCPPHNGQKGSHAHPQTQPGSVSTGVGSMEGREGDSQRLLASMTPWEIHGQTGVTAAHTAREPHPATILQALKGSVVGPTKQQGGAEGPSQRPEPPVHRSGHRSLLAPGPLHWLLVAGFLSGKCTRVYLYGQVKAADKRQ